jgi:hypothetical protein
VGQDMVNEMEKNIYAAVIHYAKYDRNKPVPADLVNICGVKYKIICIVTKFFNQFIKK